MAKIQNLFVEAANKKALTDVKAKAKKQSIFKNPAIQFIILGIVLCALQAISIIDKTIIPTKYMTVIGTIMIYSIVCSGFCLLLGYAGLASLGSSCFVGIGAYCVFFIMQQAGLPYILAILAALIVSLLLGLAIGFISLRIQGIFLGIVTLGLSEIIRNVLREIYSQPLLMSNKHLTIFGQQIGTKGMFFVIAVILVIVLIILSNLMHSPTGRSMLAMKNSTSAAQAFGINLLRYRVLAFIIACMLAAVSGVCYLSYGFSITPANASDPILAITLSLNVLAAVIIGGYKSLWGTIVGCCFVFGLSSAFSAFLPKLASQIASYTSLVIGVIMILIVMFYPGGFNQLFYVVKFKIAKAKQEKRLRKYGIEE